MPSPWLERTERWAGPAMIAAAAGLGLWGLLSDVYFWQVLGMAGAMVFVWRLTHELDRRRELVEHHPLALDGAVLLGLFGIVALLFSDAWSGGMPVTRDHMVHLARAWRYADDMLLRGQLSGWDDMWFAGWPSGESYPPGADLWMALIHTLCLGMASWETTYAIAVVAMYFLNGAAAYVFGRHYFGRLPGLLAAVLTLVELGGRREGGWTEAIVWGVWPQTLSTAFVVLGFVAVDYVISRGRPRDYIVCSSLFAAGLLTHPFAMIWMIMGIPALLFVHTLASRESAPRAIVRTLAASALAGTLAAYWYIPYLTKGSWYETNGDLWTSLTAVAQRILNGGLYHGMPSVVVLLAVVGGGFAVVRRNKMGAALLVLGTVTLVVSTSDFVERQDLGRYFKAATTFQFQRLAYLVKLCLFQLAGYGVAQVAAGSENGRRRSPWLVVVLILALSPIALAAGREYVATHVGGDGYVTAADYQDWASYHELLDEIRGLGDQDDTYFRVAYIDPGEDHIFAAAPLYTGLPALRTNFTPGTAYPRRFAFDHSGLFKVLSVKYVVSRKDREASRYDLVSVHGPFKLYRLKDYSPARYTYTGTGHAEVDTFEPGEGRARLTVAGAGADDRLTLHIGNFANWRAYRDGEPVAVESAALAGFDGFVSVAAQDGVYEFRYEMPAANQLGAAVSGCTLVFLVLLALASSRQGQRRPLSGLVALASRLRPLAVAVERRGLMVGGVLVLLPVAAIGVRVARGPVVPDSFVSHIEEATVELRWPDGADACKWTADDRFACSEEDWNYVGRIYRWAMNEDGVQYTDGQVRRCIYAHPVMNKQLTISFPDVTLGSKLEGHYVLPRKAAGSLMLSVLLDGQQVGQIGLTRTGRWLPWRVDTSAARGKAGTVSFVPTIEHSGSWEFCFDAAITD